LSDIPKVDLNCMLRIWVTQLLENAIEKTPTKINIIFFNHALDGFDIEDDG